MSKNTALNLGRPQFRSPEIAALADREGSLAAWRKMVSATGSASFADVDGEFAVGFFDDNERAFLAVDRFAINTLCYRLDGKQLRFAARADELADTGTEIDPQSIFDYFYFHIIPSPRTIYKGIFRLPAGHFAIFENGLLRVQPYWIPEFSAPADPSLGPLSNEFRKLMRDAVGAQLDGSKPACFLSGGTDSSTVAGMIGVASGRPAATYSIGFEAEGYDEMAFARIAARHFKTEHHEYYVTPNDLVRSIPDVARHYDQPFGNSSALPSYFCARMAHENGVDKLLAGDGGDELFGGNTRYAKQKLFGYYDAIPSFVRTSLLEPCLLQTPIGRLPVARKAASYVEQARLPLPDRFQQYNMLYRLGVANIFAPEFLAAVDLNEPIREQREVWGLTNAKTQTDRELAFDWRYTLAECDLPKVVGTTHLAGVAVGFPMLDHRLVDFSLRLPVAYKLKGLKLRWFFKEALRGFLPDEILTKKKQGFGLPFGVWTVKNDALRVLAEDSVRGLVDRRILRSDFVDTLFTRHLYEHPGYYGEMIWIAMMLEQWFRGNDLRSA